MRIMLLALASKTCLSKKIKQPHTFQAPQFAPTAWRAAAQRAVGVGRGTCAL